MDRKMKLERSVLWLCRLGFGAYLAVAGAACGGRSLLDVEEPDGALPDGAIHVVDASGSDASVDVSVSPPDGSPVDVSVTVDAVADVGIDRRLVDTGPDAPITCPAGQVTCGGACV